MFLVSGCSALLDTRSQLESQLQLAVLETKESSNLFEFGRVYEHHEGKSGLICLASPPDAAFVAFFAILEDDIATVYYGSREQIGGLIACVYLKTDLLF